VNLVLWIESDHKEANTSLTFVGSPPILSLAISESGSDRACIPGEITGVGRAKRRGNGIDWSLADSVPISDVAAEFGMSDDTIRSWHEQDILALSRARGEPGDHKAGPKDYRMLRSDVELFRRLLAWAWSPHGRKAEAARRAAGGDRADSRSAAKRRRHPGPDGATNPGGKPATVKGPGSDAPPKAKDPAPPPSKGRKRGCRPTLWRPGGRYRGGAKPPQRPSSRGPGAR
jgi:hypothetical protein